MRQSEAKGLVATLKASFPRQEFDQSNFNAYALGLLDLDAGLAAKAMETVCQGAKFFPTIGEIRETAARLAVQAPEPSAAFLQAQHPGPRHPLVQEARRLVGDAWHWRETEVRWLRKPFMDAYAEVMRSAIAAIAQPALAVGAIPKQLDAGLPALEEAPTEVVPMSDEVREQLARSIGYPMP